jgi:hypothetical protein
MCAVALVQKAAICASNKISQEEPMDTCDPFPGTQLAVELVKACGGMSRTLSRKRPGEEQQEIPTSKKKHVAGAS